jgi:hypothetical protein
MIWFAIYSSFRRAEFFFFTFSFPSGLSAIEQHFAFYCFFRRAEFMSIFTSGLRYLKVFF